MPRQYSMGGRATAAAGPGPGPHGGPPPARSFRERLGALRNLPPFLKLVWQTSPGLTAVDLVLRLGARSCRSRRCTSAS